MVGGYHIETRRNIHTHLFLFSTEPRVAARSPAGVTSERSRRRRKKPGANGQRPVAEREGVPTASAGSTKEVCPSDRMSSPALVLVALPIATVLGVDEVVYEASLLSLVRDIL